MTAKASLNLTGQIKQEEKGRMLKKEVRREGMS